MTLQAQLQALGVVEGSVLLVHTAFSRVRPVPDGPRGLIAALTGALGPTGTLVMPTMSDGAAPFDPTTTPTLEMGVVAETFRRLPGVVRSTHPGASFDARGPHAAPICRPQPLVPLHGPDSPVGRVWALDGWVLLLGVSHDADTTVHLAEVLAGVPYWQAHPCVVVRGGAPEVLHLPETDHCCRGFDQLVPHLPARVGPVGQATATLARSRDIVDTATALLQADPLTFLCAPAVGCPDCDAARRSVGTPAPSVPAVWV